VSNILSKASSSPSLVVADSRPATRSLPSLFGVDISRLRVSRARTGARMKKLQTSGQGDGDEAND
jgi:hypothetical protein